MYSNKRIALNNVTDIIIIKLDERKPTPSMLAHKTNKKKRKKKKKKKERSICQ